MWRDAAAAVGASVQPVADGFLRIERDGRRTMVWENLVALDDPVTLKLAGTKPVTHLLLGAAGVPVPDHVEVTAGRLDDAVPLLDAGPCVVKPARSTGRGTGVTCGVRTVEQLERAALRASRWDERLLVERQLDGDEYRVTVLDGRALGAVRRRAPSVVGDGRTSVGDLIVAENRRRADAGGELGLWPIRIDLDCVFALEHAGLALTSVPAADQRVEVKSAVNENGVADNETVEPVPPCVAAAAVAAARAVGARLAAVDIVTADPDRPLADVGAVVEVNTTPGFLYHHHVADRATATEVEIPILQTLLREAR
jgi:D-alanine-D-alanine ligase-like ATP-grasp enzyme